MIKVNAQRTKYGNVKTAVANGKEISNLMIGAAIASQAKLLAPVDYGQLRNSLSASSTSRTEMLNNMAGEKAEALDTQGLKDDEVYAGSNSDHAIFQEYGTVKQPAQPYLRPAMEAVVQRKTPAEIFEKYGREAMDRELKRRK
ncbi:MAG: HK97-gp10 family putative phage morphogenesis protein [Advenella sp.]